MEMESIKSKALNLNINVEGKDKTELIRTIQIKEGYRPCFGHGMFVCNNLECCWRSSCLETCGIIKFEVIDNANNS